MDLKTALTAAKYRRSDSLVEINGVRKTKQAWCDEYGISPQLYEYRVKYSKLSPLEALTKEKEVRKQKVVQYPFSQMLLFEDHLV